MKQLAKYSSAFLASVSVLCSFVSISACRAAQTPLGQPTQIESTPIRVDKLDPAFDKIVPADAMLERVASGFRWVEGPVWAQNKLFFAEIPSNSIRTWSTDKGVEIFLQPSGYQGTAPYGGREPGSNGMTLDTRGRLTMAGHARRDIYRLEFLDPKAQITILADTYQGKLLNSPNDLVYKSDGSLYFTDPPYGLRTQGDNDPESSSASTASTAFLMRSRKSPAQNRRATSCNCSSAICRGPTESRSRPTRNISM
jgi:gluconolactonase